MNIDELPETQLVIRAHSREGLLEYLGSAMGLAGIPDQVVEHFLPVGGDQRSIRVFTAKAIPESVPLIRPFGPRELARELMDFAERYGARYPTPPLGRAAKGWEVRCGVVRGQPAIVALAAWISM